MIVLFDANFLLMLFDEKARAPKRAGKPVIKNASERIELLVQDLSKKRTKIIVPTPALAEFLLMASDSYDRYLAEIKKRTVFEVFGFDDPACIELVDMSLALGKPKKNKPEDTWAKLKYDRQIIAIGKVNRAQQVYTTDDGVRNLAIQAGMKPIDLEDLPEPPPRQTQLDLAGGAKPAKNPESDPGAGTPPSSAGS
jgi:hypothetical protein